MVNLTALPNHEESEEMVPYPEWFFTAYPTNVFLLAARWKEKMPQSKREMKRRMLEQLNARAA
ncbi:MAG TPA: hypothetical protein VFQ24_16505 [Terriglobia bacterium]|nr:hypothetical protein [Terriglobia bacterium]